MSAVKAKQRAGALPRGRNAPKDINEIAFKLLVAYFFIEYVRPQDRVGGLGALKIGLLITVVCAYFWLRYGDKSVLKDSLIRTHIAFILVVGATVTFAVNTFWVFQVFQSLSLMLIAGVLPSTMFLSQPGKMTRFAKAWVIFHVILAVTAFRSGGRGPGAFLGDENDLALALNMAIPWAFFMSQSPQITPLARNLYRLAMVVILIASIFTWSRGGFLGLIAAMGIIWLLSKHKIRNMVVIVVLGVSVIGGFSVFSDKGSVLAEFETIDDPNDSTRRDRIESWKRGWEMFIDNPILGVGASNYGWRVGEYQLRDPTFDINKAALRAGRAAHSLYFTLMPELGLAGTLLYIAMVWQIISRMLKVTKMKAADPVNEAALMDLSLLAKALIASLVAFLISGAFITVVYYPHLFYLVGFTMAVHLGAKRLTVKPGEKEQPKKRGRGG